MKMDVQGRQQNSIGVAQNGGFVALLLWLGLATCVAMATETMETELSEQTKLQDRRASPGAAHHARLDPVDPAGNPAMAGQAIAAPATDFTILGEQVAPGVVRQLNWTASQNYAGMGLRAPVLVANGRYPGKVLCLTGAIHGDEINGVEIVRRILNEVVVERLRGTLVGVPIVNTHGFERSHRYLEDRRDLNRSFPGQPYGSSAARIAHSLFSQIVARCDVLVDIHTGTAGHTRLAQVRADLGNAKVAALIEGFGAMPVVASMPSPGSLRGAAANTGIAAVTLEVGEPGRLQTALIEGGVRSINSLMWFLNMTPAPTEWRIEQSVQVLYRSLFKVRAPRGGMLITSVQVGDSVASGEILATIVDPVQNVKTTIHAPDQGRVLGMALSQMVVPGFTLFQLGIEETNVNRKAESAVSSAGASVEFVADTVSLVAADIQSSVTAR